MKFQMGATTEEDNCWRGQLQMGTNAVGAQPQKGTTADGCQPGWVKSS